MNVERTRRRARALRWLLALAVALSGTTIMPSARADRPEPDFNEDPVAAAKEFAEGKRLYDNHEFEKARVALQAAYDHDPTAEHAANLGAVEIVLQRYVAAYRHLSDAIKTFERQNRTEQADSLRASLAAAASEIAILRIYPSADADVILDDRQVGFWRFRKYLAEPVEPGHHVLSASRPGYTSDRTQVDVAKGQTRDVLLFIDPIVSETTTARAVPETAPTASPPAATGSRSVGSWLTIATGAGISGILITTGVGLMLNYGEHGRTADMYSDALASRGMSCGSSSPGAADLCTSMHDATNAQDRDLTWGVAALAAGGALAIGTVIYAMASSPTPPARAEARLSLSARAVVDGHARGMMLEGRF